MTTAGNCHAGYWHPRPGCGHGPYRHRKASIGYLRQNALANRVYETYDTIVTACCKAWNDLIELPDTIKSIASREWLQCVSS